MPIRPVGAAKEERRAASGDQKVDIGGPWVSIEEGIKVYHLPDNPDVAPHLSFADLGGHGYATVRVSARDGDRVRGHPAPDRAQRAPDGGSLAYRVIHRVKMWRPGEPPRLVAQVMEGAPPLAMKS